MKIVPLVTIETKDKDGQTVRHLGEHEQDGKRIGVVIEFDTAEAKRLIKRGFAREAEATSAAAEGEPPADEPKGKKGSAKGKKASAKGSDSNDGKGSEEGNDSDDGKSGTGETGGNTPVNPSALE